MHSVKGKETYSASFALLGLSPLSKRGDENGRRPPTIHTDRVSFVVNTNLSAAITGELLPAFRGTGPHYRS